MKYLKHLGMVGIVGTLTSLIKGIIGFYSGYHNLDIAFNFLQLGFTQDINLNSQLVGLKDYYLIGLNSMLGGLGWLCLAVILAFISGYLIKKEVVK